MNSQLSIADPAKFKERLAETIQASFGMMLDGADFKALVDKEVNAFFYEPLGTVKLTPIVKRVTYGGHNEYSREETSKNEFSVAGTGVTPFRAMAWQMLMDRLKPEFEKLLQNDEFIGKLAESMEVQYARVDIAPTVQAMIKANAPAFMEMFFTKMSQDAMSSVAYQMRNMLSGAFHAVSHGVDAKTISDTARSNGYG